MRAVVQRVSEAWVRVESEVVGRIGTGLLVLLGVGRGDTEADADYLLYGDARKGRRPGYTEAAAPEAASRL